MEPRTQEKKDRLLAALDKGMVMVHLDARRPGVVVPAQFRQEAHLRLNLSYRFDPPDLSVGDWGARSTLTFSGERFTVAIPWSALFAVASHVTHEFWLFPEDMPKELMESAQLTEKVDFVSDAPTKPERPMLRAVDALVEEERPKADPPEPPAPEKPSRAHLRLVK